MHPYRNDTRARAVGDGDDRTISIVLLGFGVLRVVIALAAGERFGAEATLALLMIALGGAGFLRST